MSRPFLSAGFAAVLAAGLAAGCTHDPGPLDVGALRPAERRYVERYVTLERARAVALADPARGVAILDSLAAAWGDTAEGQATAGLPADPRRAARVQELVGRLLAAEIDSLLHAPLPRRLRAPLPQPVPAEGS